jgi:hypothetical protein
MPCALSPVGAKAVSILYLTVRSAVHLREADQEPKEWDYNLNALPAT